MLRACIPVAFLQVCIAFFAPQNADAQVGAGQITGIVTDRDQTPVPGAAQEPTPRFEVVSVKPLPPGSNIAGYRPEPTRFHGYFSVMDTVSFGYQIEHHRIVEAPQWAKEQRYEINATTAQRKPGRSESHDA